MRKISRAVLYISAFCLAIMAGTFALVKSFGIASSAPKIYTKQPLHQFDDNSNKNCKISSFKMQNYIDSAFLSKKTANLCATKTQTLPLNNNKDYETSAQAMALLEVNSGRLIASKEGNKKLPMASLTKIITAIVAIENNADLDTKLEIPKAAVGIEGSSIYLRAGEHLTMRELLYGLMLRSGNDSAVAIAILTSGSVENFMKLANDFCAKLGATNTNLVTPNGLHDDNHYTTAEDLAKITAYALKNKTFAEVVGTKYKTIDNELSKKEKNRLLKNKNKFLDMLEGADGVKTGYTKKAGRCFVGSSTRAEDGMQLVCVLINCQPMFQDCQKLIAQAQKDYKMYNLLDDTGYESYISVSGSNTHTILCGSKNGFSYPLTEDEYNSVEVHNNLNKKFTAPINAGEIVGEVQILVDKTLIFCDNILAKETAQDNTYLGTLDKIIDDFAMMPR